MAFISWRMSPRRPVRGCRGRRSWRPGRRRKLLEFRGGGRFFPGRLARYSMTVLSAPAERADLRPLAVAEQVGGGAVRQGIQVWRGGFRTGSACRSSARDNRAGADHGLPSEFSRGRVDKEVSGKGARPGIRDDLVVAHFVIAHDEILFNRPGIQVPHRHRVARGLRGERGRRSRFQRARRRRRSFAMTAETPADDQRENKTAIAATGENPRREDEHAGMATVLSGPGHGRETVSKLRIFRSGDAANLPSSADITG